jgi:nucleotide-binding universal stress UspA family protein
MSLLIVPTDYSPNAEKALDQALVMAQERGDQVELLHVYEITRYANIPKVLEQVMKEKKQEEAKLQELLTRRVTALGLDAKLRRRVKVIYADDLISAIINRFHQAKARLVLMGTHGATDLGGKLLGSHTAQVIGKAKVPVLAVPPQWSPSPIKKLRVCVQPNQVHRHGSLIKKWEKWFGCEVQGISFSALPGLQKIEKSPFPIQTIQDPIETPLYQDLVNYSETLKNEAMVMFVHRRSFFEKIFNTSITKKVAKFIQVPLLALPVAEAE